MEVKETAPAYLTQKKPFTYQDFLELPEDEHLHQLINGELLKTPSPNVDHQTIVTNIMDDLRAFVKKTHAGRV